MKQRLFALVVVGIVGVFMLCMSACDEFFPSEHALDHITVTPTSQFMKTGDNVQLSVQGVNGDGTTSDLTSSATYTSSNTGVANPSTTTKGLITAGSNGNATITVTASGTSATVQVNVFTGTLQTISVTPNAPTITLSLGTTTQQLTATGQFSDNTQNPITNLVAWTSSNTAVATVNATTGLVTAVAQGTATITASANVTGSTTPVTGTANVTVQ